MGLCCRIALRPFCALHVTLPSHLVCFRDCTDHAPSLTGRWFPTGPLQPLMWVPRGLGMPTRTPRSLQLLSAGAVTSGCFGFRVKTEDLRQVHVCVGSETGAPAAPQPLHHCRHLQVCSHTCSASISPFLSSTCTHRPVPCSAWAQDARGPHRTPAPWCSPSSEGQETTPGSHTHVGFRDRTSTSWVGRVDIAWGGTRGDQRVLPVVPTLTRGGGHGADVCMKQSSCTLQLCVLYDGMCVSPTSVEIKMEP